MCRMWKVYCWGKAPDSFASSRLNASRSRQWTEIVCNKFQDLKAKIIPDFSRDLGEMSSIIVSMILAILDVQIQIILDEEIFYKFVAPQSFGIICHIRCASSKWGVSTTR